MYPQSQRELFQPRPIAVDQSRAQQLAQAAQSITQQEEERIRADIPEEFLVEELERWDGLS